MSNKPSLQEHHDMEMALLAYLTEVDAMDNIDALVATFTEDATVDLSGLNLPVLKGSAAIHEFFSGVFEMMTHHMHTMTNFRVSEYDGSTARTHAYICGMGRSTAGVDIQVYVYYDLQMRKTEAGWKISHFYEAPKLPMDASIDAVHNS